MSDVANGVIQGLYCAYNDLERDFLPHHQPLIITWSRIHTLHVNHAEDTAPLDGGTGTPKTGV